MEREEVLKLISEVLNSREKENKNMDANYSRTNIDDFLTVRGFGGYGYGGGGYGGGGSLYTGNNVLAADAHADGSGRGENIKANRHFAAYGHAKLSDEHDTIERNAQFHQLFEQNSDNAMGAERRFLALNNQIADNAAKAAECCCKLGKEIAEVKTDLVALNKDTVIEGLKSQLLDAKFDALNGNGHGRK